MNIFIEPTGFSKSSSLESWQFVCWTARCGRSVAEGTSKEIALFKLMVKLKGAAILIKNSVTGKFEEKTCEV